MLPDGGSSDKKSGPLLRSEFLSRALAEAARRSRFSSRTRRRLTAGGGFASRRGETMYRVFVSVSFLVLVFLPSAVAATYYLLIASDQYVAEAKFTIRGGNIPKLSGLGADLASLTVIQDTLIVTNFMESRALVEQLDKKINLRHLYGSHNIDSLARFDPSKSTEKLLSYWNGMCSVSIAAPSGIVTVAVRAFRPEDAMLITTNVLELGEALVNEMNERVRRDSLTASQQELERSMQRLRETRRNLESARNFEGMLDAGQTANALSALITSVQADRIRMQQEYDTQLRNVSADAPQMRALKAGIAAASTQLDQLQAKMTAQGGTENNDRALSESFTKFSTLGLENQIAERQYASAAATLEIARVNAERKQVYLSSFVSPSLPQTPRYPRRALYPFLVLVAASIIWGIICGTLSAIRNYMA